MSGPSVERPGTKILDYIALGLLLAPPAVGVEVYLKDGTLGGRRLLVATVVCWALGALVVLASHYWQSWRTANGRLVPLLISAENKFWVKGIIIAASMGGALTLSSLLSEPPVVVHDPRTAEDVSKANKSLQDEAQRKVDSANRERDTAIQQRDAALSKAALRQPSQGVDVYAPAVAGAPQPPPSPLINWGLDSQFLVVSGAGPTATVGSVLLQGTSTASVAIKDAYAVSGLTGHKQYLMANVQNKGYFPPDKIDIPPLAHVWLELIFKPPLLIRDFLDQWGKLTVTIIYADSSIYTHEFDEAYVRQKIQQQVPDVFEPHVTPKDDK